VFYLLALNPFVSVVSELVFDSVLESDLSLCDCGARTEFEFAKLLLLMNNS
jgi:hypothetical protein